MKRYNVIMGKMVSGPVGSWVKYEDAIDKATSMYKKGKEDALCYARIIEPDEIHGTVKVEKCPECGESFTERQDRYTDGEWARSQSYGCPNNCDQLEDGHGQTPEASDDEAMKNAIPTSVVMTHDFKKGWKAHKEYIRHSQSKGDYHEGLEEGIKIGRAEQDALLDEAAELLHKAYGFTTDDESLLPERINKLLDALRNRKTSGRGEL